MTKPKTKKPAPKKPATVAATNGTQTKTAQADPPAEKTQAWERGKAFKTSPHTWEDPQEVTE